MYNIDIRTN